MGKPGIRMARQSAISERTSTADNERKQVKNGDKRHSLKAALGGRGTMHLIMGVKAWCVVQTLLGDGCESGNLWTFFSHCFNLLNETGDEIIS